MRKLSVLMCAIPGRENKYVDYFNRPDIEFIWLGDNMVMSIGEKRQWLLKMAMGDYVCFIDDDDTIHAEYIDTILTALERNTDVVNFKVRYVDNKIDRPVYYSIAHKRDQDLKDKFLRIPNHLMVVKRHLALKAGYKYMGTGQDADYSQRLIRYIKTEFNIDKTLYTYTYNHDISKGRYSISGRRE